MMVDWFDCSIGEAAIDIVNDRQVQAAEIYWPQQFTRAVITNGEKVYLLECVQNTYWKVCMQMRHVTLLDATSRL